jgi:hypothetical protein
MRRWLAVAGAAAVMAVAACSSASALPPGAAAHIAALKTATPNTGTPNTVTLAAGPRSSATLDVLTGTTELRIGTAAFGAGGALLRVSTPAGAPPPRLRETGGNAEPGPGTDVDLSVPGAPSVTVTLNAAVRWRLVLGGGTTRTDADLRGAQLTGIAFTAGSAVISVALPRPRGSVPVRLAGGASQFLLSLPGGVPARVTAAGGSVFTTPGWAPGATGFDIDATAGASRFSVTARASG